MKIKIHPALYVVTALLILWELVVIFFDVAPYILPAPSKIFLRIFVDIDLLLKNAFVTFSEAFLGLILATLLGVGIALLFQLFPKVNKSCQAILVGFQSFPKEAIAPLLVVWFGFGISSKIIMACLIAIFPIFISTYKGLNSVPNEMILTFRALRISAQQIVLHIRFLYALPFLFPAIRTASTLSIVGAVIGEFVGSSFGLGRLILIANSQFSIDLTFACLIVLGLIGMVMDVGWRYAEKKLIPWHESLSSHSVSTL